MVQIIGYANMKARKMIIQINSGRLMATKFKLIGDPNPLNVFRHANIKKYPQMLYTDKELLR
jgi:hypothetical protein